MDIESKRPERRVRVRGKGLAVVTLSPEVTTPENWSIRKQVARTLGFPRDFEHPDIEVLYKMTDTEYSHPLIGFIHKELKRGIRFKEGDRIAYHPEPSWNHYTVEFRKAEEENLLRAVILELDAKYQSLSTEEAVKFCYELYEQEEKLFDTYEIDDGILDDL